MKVEGEDQRDLKIKVTVDIQTDCDMLCYAMLTLMMILILMLMLCYAVLYATCSTLSASCYMLYAICSPTLLDYSYVDITRRTQATQVQFH